ncbi:endonuclease/exonuclease/phosphatase family protein [Salinispirillum marinum]|uniref:Endonuclease/exonuclease/phosphatase family protein n=2 Tax=Saccharospirillaceae TaxID=255527 RepID=A0ABV8BGG9_9GAMM
MNMVFKRVGTILMVGLMLMTAILNAAVAEPFRIATFNVHYISPNQTKMVWADRRDAVVAALSDMNADLVAFQEMETFIGGSGNPENQQLDWVLQHLPEYQAAAVGDPRTYPATQPIIYRAERFTPLEQGYFFYSATPDVIYSRQWNGGHAYFSSWVKFLDRQTEQAFYVLNVHNDYSSRSNRIKTTELIMQRMQPWLQSDAPIVVLGDLNAPGWFAEVAAIRDLGFTLASSAGSTFHFNRGLHLFPAIDHILFTGFQQQGDTERLNRRYDGVWPSDHHPVYISLQ